MASQFGQDHFVLKLLQGLRGGFFLDSGASDGVEGSNTYLLEASYGWMGICVEPNDSFFEALVRNRRCRCVKCCLYDREGPVNFVEASFLGGIFDEYQPMHLRHVKDMFQLDGVLATKTKPAHTLESVLRACGAPPVIDYWSLDTEGSELTILKSFPFDQYSFRVLTVEHNHLPVRSEIQELLDSRGYWRIAALEIDDCYVRGRPANPAWRSHVWR
jgi:hypothetical protein